MSVWQRLKCWWGHRKHVETSDTVANVLMLSSFAWTTYVCPECRKRYCYRRYS